MNEYYVYVLFRPNGVPCYIGKGKGKRWKTHEKRASNPMLAKIIASAGGEIPKVKIREGLTEQEAFETEIAFIKAIGRMAHGGPLVNMTDGGEGVSNPLPETRYKIGSARRGKVVTDETRMRMSEARKKAGDCLTEAGRARLAELTRSRNLDPAFQAKMLNGRAKMSAESKAALGKAISDAKKGKPMSIAQRQWLSESQRGKKRGPYSKERCAAISAAKKGRPFTEEHKAALRAAKGRKLLEETRIR